MEIRGLNKTTLLDYPGHVAATVFTGGCNFRCPFCHNGDLVQVSAGQPVIPEEEIFGFLKKRAAILEGVCVTGGEPTLQEDLREFLLRLKELGYLVKLDTNGYSPNVLQRLLQEELLDYVAMDIKASLGNYPKAAGCPELETSRIEASVRLLKNGGIPYEFRTTVVKGIHTVEEFEEIGKWLAGSKAYFLQGFRKSGNEIRPGYESVSRSVMEEMAEKVKKYIDKVELRGIE